MNATAKLDEIKGRTFLINAKRQKILNYKLDNGSVIIATDKDIFEFDRSELDSQLRSFLPANEKHELPILRSVRNELPNMAEIIFDNIKKVQGDRNYISQATAVDKGINTLINLMKAELSLVKAMQKE